MQFSSMTLLILAAATGAIAAPGNRGPSGPPSRPPPPPPVDNTNINQQTNVCGNGIAPYCCINSICKQSSGFCNGVSICCNNNAQQGGNAQQNCGAVGGNNFGGLTFINA